MTRYLALTIVGFSGFVLAGTPAYEEVDANHDGEIDAAEAEAVDGLDFRAADTNQDRVLSREEFARAVNAPAPPSLVEVQ